MPKLNDVYKKKQDDWVSRVIVDEAVIVPLRRGEEDISYIYSISNPTGMRIWQLLDGEHSVRHILEALASEYQVQEEAVERDVIEFFRDLLQAQLIEKVQDRTKSSEPDPPATKKRIAAEEQQYEKPEIAKIKMEPEQAVLSCCVATTGAKIAHGGVWCTFGDPHVCPVTDCVDFGSNHEFNAAVS
jgi:hypothetical protein